MHADPNILTLLAWLRKTTQDIHFLCPEAPKHIADLERAATSADRDRRSGYRVDLSNPWDSFQPTIRIGPEAPEDNLAFDGEPAALLGLFDLRIRKIQFYAMRTSSGRRIACAQRSLIDSTGFHVRDDTKRELPLLPPQARIFVRHLLEEGVFPNWNSERIRRELLRQIQAQAA